MWVSLIVFDDRVKTLAPAKPVGDRKGAIRSLGPCPPRLDESSWRLADGCSRDSRWREAGGPGPRHSAFSDGNANVGETTETNEIAALCANAAERASHHIDLRPGARLQRRADGRNGESAVVAITTMAIPQPTCSNLRRGSSTFSNLYARHVRLALAVPGASRSRC